MTTYISILSSPAQSIDPKITASVFPVVESSEAEAVFNYFDTASSRAGINVITSKLEIGKLAIVGMGGTGSYVLDLVAKTPVKEFHLFDGDKYLNHNAFRSPGAPSVDELRGKPQKVHYFAKLYSKMRRKIIAHDSYMDVSNIDCLREMDFVFLCLDRGKDKRVIIARLEEWDIPFIDVGMGVQLANDSLLGVLRVTSSTVKKRDHVRDNMRIPFSDEDDDNEYIRNIQIADLNALNAALAVIKWKKMCSFYLDLENEYCSAYVISGNTLINDDQQ